MPLSEEDIAYINPKVDYIVVHYRDAGCSVNLCSHCGLIINIIWPEGSVHGPSLSTIHFCRCEQEAIQGDINKIKGGRR
jgi:hypothetical protein